MIIFFLLLLLVKKYLLFSPSILADLLVTPFLRLEGFYVSNH